MIEAINPISERNDSSRLGKRVHPEGYIAMHYSRKEIMHKHWFHLILLLPLLLCPLAGWGQSQEAPQSKAKLVNCGEWKTLNPSERLFWLVGYSEGVEMGFIATAADVKALQHFYEWVPTKLRTEEMLNRITEYCSDVKHEDVEAYKVLRLIAAEFLKADARKPE